MRRLGTLLFVAVTVLIAVPDWTGPARLELLGPHARVTARRVALDPANPARRRVGALTWQGGVELFSPDPAFGGFSALSVEGDRFTLLSDGGNVLRFRLRDGRITDPAFGNLPAGPMTGWEKRDRDSESMTTDPRTGTMWVGFERANAIWRYTPGLGRAERFARPPAMHGWQSNGGPESMTRLRDGRFLVIAEEETHGPGREALLFAGDPTAGGTPLRFRYLPPAGGDPSDVTQLPDGRILVLNRLWSLPLRFASVLVVIDPRAIRSGARLRGREIARLGAPLIHANFEGVTTTIEGGRTMLWLCSDDDQSEWEHSYLVKFALAG